MGVGMLVSLFFFWERGRGGVGVSRDPALVTRCVKVVIRPSCIRDQNRNPSFVLLVALSREDGRIRLLHLDWGCG